MTETKVGRSLMSEVISWSQRWGEEPPAEIKAEMLRIEEKARRILTEGSDERLTAEEVFYLNNKDAEIF